MRELAKRLLPGPAIRAARRVRDTLVYRRAPRRTSFRGNARDVLQCCVAYNEHGGYCVPSSGRYRPAAQKILAGEVWEAETIEFVSSSCGSGDVVHAGTFFGDFLPALSRSLAPGANVWAFEPNPESYRCASITVRINRLDNVELTNAAIGEKPGTLPLITSDPSGRSLGGASRIRAEISAADEDRCMPVEVVTVDDVVPPDRRVSVIQLDVEGFEREALIGSLATIRRCKPILVLETPPEERWLSENIHALGYVRSGRVDANTVFRPK